MKTTIKIGIADDQTMFREGLSQLLNNQQGISVEIEAKNGVDLIKQLKKKDVDVVLIDYRMPELNGLDTSSAIKESFPDVKILILSMYSDKDIVVMAVENGANGYITKDSSINEMVLAIESVMKKGYYANESVADSLLTSLFKEGNLQSQKADNANALTEMEVNVIKLICKEFSTKEIANEIFRGVRTVEGIRSNILKKTGAKNSNGIVMYAIKNGIVEL
jgi:DNA-binding NarL/FixJ family response regulator